MSIEVVATTEPAAEADRLGEQIAELSAHLEAETAQLLDLIREFDARRGWNHGFRSCAHWLNWRVGMQPLAAARETLYQRTRSTPSWPEDIPVETPSMEQQKADALTLLAESALYHSLDPGAAGERYQVVVHVDAVVLADAEAPGQSALDGGIHVPAGTSQRLACDATRVIMRHDPDGQIVEVGARTRTMPPALRRALHHRDRGCRFPGCSVSFGQCHHIRHWANRGPTTLSNLTMLCRRHHRAVHEEGYQVERRPDGELSFRRPDGRLLPEVPAPPAVADDPVQALRAMNAASGLHLDAQTTRPGWLWERLDVGYAIDILHPRALEPRALGGR